MRVCREGCRESTEVVYRHLCLDRLLFPPQYPLKCRKNQPSPQCPQGTTSGWRGGRVTSTESGKVAGRPNHWWDLQTGSWGLHQWTEKNGLHLPEQVLPRWCTPICGDTNSLSRRWWYTNSINNAGGQTSMINHTSCQSAHTNGRAKYRPVKF